VRASEHPLPAASWAWIFWNPSPFLSNSPYVFSWPKQYLSLVLGTGLSSQCFCCWIRGIQHQGMEAVPWYRGGTVNLFNPDHPFSSLTPELKIFVFPTCFWHEPKSQESYIQEKQIF
jgi:hypothetical protein